VNTSLTNLFVAIWQRDETDFDSSLSAVVGPAVGAIPAAAHPELW
jgi:hypothetical protein